MTAFHPPSSQASRRQRDTIRGRPTLLQGGRIPLRLTRIPRRLPRVPFVAAEVLWGTIPWIRPLQDAIGQRRGQQRDIRRFRAAHDEGQWDATPVDQQAVLAPIFFPDPWGSVPQLLAPTGPSLTTHQYSARSRRYTTSRRIPSAQPARGAERTRRPATVKNTDESHSDSQTVLWATPSIGSRFGGHRRSRPRLAWGATASVRPRVFVDSPDSGLVAAGVSTAQLSARRHLRLPMIARFVCVSCLGPMRQSSDFCQSLFMDKF
jgi:hypothetical protein